MSGHVSMMNDVLIAQMPASLLRATMRFIVSQDPTARQLLSQHVRTRLVESAPAFPDAQDLFPSSGDVRTLEAYLSIMRYVILDPTTDSDLISLIHLVQAIIDAQASWTTDSTLEKIIHTSSADIVQAIQAVKESGSRPDKLESSLLSLLRNLDNCNRYCTSKSLSRPYSRAQTQVIDAVSLLYPSDHLNGYVSPPSTNDSLPIDFTAKSIESINGIEKVSFGGKLVVPRIFNGFWQMSSPAWGSTSAAKMDDALVDLIKHGLVAADMADHYGDAELVYGSFRNRLPDDIARQVITATKWCVFAPLHGPITEEMVLAAVLERTNRVAGQVHLLQFHWQDYNNKDYLIIIKMLVNLTHIRPDLVATIGLCNFDAKRTEEVCKYMLQETGEVGVVSNQVQFSLIDSRPIFGMAQVCEKYQIRLLTYGSFCGGFLSDRWLDKDSPDGYGEATPLTPSQRKYLDMIYAWGSWQEFSSLLQILHRIAAAHDAEIANVATRWVLQQPAVGAVIVGTRLGVSSNLTANLNVFTFTLSKEQLAEIESVALGPQRAKALALFKHIGDCGEEYR
ncbi:hypothetical protein P7C73_g1318, partial [Tremellales sp. Uapishka_1]